MHDLDLRAIILVGASSEGQVIATEHFSEYPLGFIDVLGRPVTDHVIAQLERQGVVAVTVISEGKMPPPRWRQHQGRATVKRIEAAPQIWRTAESAFSEHAQNGAEEVLILRLGPYAEIDVDAFLQAHLDSPGHVTRAIDAGAAPMDIFLVTGSRRNEAAYLFRHRLQESRGYCATWTLNGYCNRLGSARDLRCLAVDGLLQRNQIKPAGHEIRPGIWIGRRARLERGARVLAPAFVGDHVKVRANAVITRCSVVERHCEVASGSVVEDASVLPYTYVGPRLDISRALIGNQRLVNLERDLEIEIRDPQLIDSISLSPGVRVVASAISLAAYLPTQLLRGLRSAVCRDVPEELPAAVTAPSPALNTPAGFPGSPSAAEVHSFQRTWQ